MDERRMADSPVIRLHGVTRVYRTGENEVHALRGIDLSIEAGEFVAIMGRSGSGKSTLMNIVGCLDVATAGTYALRGWRVDGLSRNERANVRNHLIGFVFQGFNLLARTSALHNVELPLLYVRDARTQDTRALAMAALESVGLAGWSDHEPTELSGGQQQRVAIARALVTGPALILADEPTGNLDTRTSLEIMVLFQQLNAQGKTIVMVTHEPDIARYAGRIVELRDGRVRRDVRVRERRSAAADLAALGEEEDEAATRIDDAFEDPAADDVAFEEAV